MQTDPYIVLPCFSLEPNKLATFNRVFVKSQMSKTGVFEKSKAQQNTITRDFHNFEISQNAHRTLKRKINWLYYLAKSKNVTTYSGKNIFNFKMSFITLTLPSAQQHTTAFITKNLFNQFLTELRQRTNLENYVWRLEFQTNGNVHYHIATDIYLDYFFIQKIWNRILDLHMYITPYTEKFKNLTLSAYNKLVNPSGKTDFSIIAKRFAKGCENKWNQPNTIDVKSVTNQKNISSYIAKYFSKNAENKTKCNKLDNEINSKSLRLWFCSRSLSKLNSITDFSEAVQINWSALIADIKNVRKRVFEYATLFYFDFKNLCTFESEIIHKTLKNYAYSLNYCSA